MGDRHHAAQGPAEVEGGQDGRGHGRRQEQEEEVVERKGPRPGREQGLVDEDTYARLLAEVPKMKLITPSALVERLKINGALARAAIKELQEKGMIKMVSYHHTQWIFTRDVAAE